LTCVLIPADVFPNFVTQPSIPIIHPHHPTQTKKRSRSSKRSTSSSSSNKRRRRHKRGKKLSYAPEKLSRKICGTADFFASVFEDNITNEESENSDDDGMDSISFDCLKGTKSVPPALSPTEPSSSTSTSAVKPAEPTQAQEDGVVSASAPGDPAALILTAPMAAGLPICNAALTDTAAQPVPIIQRPAYNTLTTGPVTQTMPIQYPMHHPSSANGTQYFFVRVQTAPHGAPPTAIGQLPYFPVTATGQQPPLMHGLPNTPQVLPIPIQKQGVRIPKLHPGADVPPKKRNVSLEEEKDIRTTLEPGVRPSRTPGRWEAHLTVRGAGSSGYVHLGTFLTREKASEVRLWAVQMREKNENADAKTMKELVREAFPECFSKSKKAKTAAAAVANKPSC
jgi:hypothetical protein